ncbi:MAG: CBS domain-containing protein [Deltaproteobacteria bacterium]|nr:CBS domain-containing protein [Deltaproteobacteria bacterium]
MKSMMIKDLMIPLADYATVREEATLYEAVLALEASQKKVGQHRARHRAVLVLGAGGDVSGKLDMTNVLKGLEPRYVQIEETEQGGPIFTTEFIRSMMEKYSLWEKPLDDLCKKAARIKVKDLVLAPTEGEYIPEGSTLDEAVHQLVISRHQSLLVTRDGRVVGILRLSDVFERVCEQIKACQL